MTSVTNTYDAFWPFFSTLAIPRAPKTSKSALYVVSLKAWKVGPQPQCRPNNFQHLPSSSFQVTPHWVFFFGDLKSGVKTWPPPFLEKIKRSLGGFNFFFIFTSNIGKIPSLTNIFFKWVETTIFVEEILHQVEIYRILHQVPVDMDLISTVIFLIDYGKNIRSLKLTVRP